MTQKFHFNKLSLFWGIFLILGIAISIAAIDVIGTYRDFNFHSEKLRSDFINSQKEIIKQEVMRVAELISHEKSQSKALTKQTIKTRVYEAWSIADNIYQKNRTTADTKQIISMIKDALRPIRFERGNGYYFMTDLGGVELLFADRPEIEGKNLLSLQDSHGKYVVKDMIEIARNQGEGFYHYHWTKPGLANNNFEKISFIKNLESLNCFIGAGLYIDDIEAGIKERLLASISRIRFGKEGYIFINHFNGDALVTNGKRVTEKKKLWEVFSSNPDKAKQLFAKEHKAAITSGGDYIYYSYSKLHSPDIASPKASFILGIPDLQWLVGAGVYLDDVEAEIKIMQEHLRKRTFNQNIRKDIDIITTFFNEDIKSDKPIDRAQLKFHEFDTMAKDINTMFTEKIFVQQNLYAEQMALLESEEKFRNTMDSTLIGVYIIQDLHFQYVNPAMSLMFGYSKEELLNNVTPLDLVAPAHREQARKNLLRRQSGKLTRINDIKCIRSNGEIFDTMVLGAATVHQGKAASVGTMIDITERKAAEDELRRSKNRATALLEAIPDMVFRMSSDGVYLDVKADTKELYVASRDEIIGKTSNELLPPELAKRITKKIESTIRSGKMHTFEYQLEMMDGETTYFEARMVKSGKNEITAIVRNITEHNKAAEEKNALERQLNQAKRMESIGLMAGGVAHDLNNILSGIVGHPDLILQKIPADSDIRKQVEAIRDSGMRAAAVVDDLLTVARGAASTRAIHPLNTLVAEYLDSPECTKLKSLHPTVQFIQSLTKEETNISCSAVHIKKCIMNLVTNGAEAITENGTITVSTKSRNIDKNQGRDKGLTPGKYVVLGIHDNGPGISKLDIEHIFEPFYSKKSMSRSGTGLGLTVVWNTVRDHNGKIFVDSDHSGTEFEIYFPLQEAAESEGEKQKDALIDIKSSAQGEHILVVDDEPLLRDVACDILSFLGYTVDSVASGEEAIEFVQSTKVDLLLIDMLMEPGLNGHETYEAIHALHPGQKAVIASGYSENKDIKASLDLGAQAFIKKPYTLEQLGAVVRETLQGKV